MGSYLQGYGAGEERRNRTIKWIIIGTVSAILLAWILYAVLHDYSETQTVREFLSEVNGHDYKTAYRAWGCTDTAPCANYDYKRFLEDWGPDKKISSPWKVASVDGCKSFVTVNVQADGSELQSLGVQRGAKTLMFAPSPECQERKWHWKAFFRRILGRDSSTPS